MPLSDYSPVRDDNAAIVPGTIRIPPGNFWAQQLVNAIRQLMADLAAGIASNVVTPQMFGTGVGTGSVSLDSDAMQLAVDSLLPVFLPRLSVPYKFSDIALPHSAWVFGNSYGEIGPSTAADYFLINGDGAAPIFKVGTYGSGITNKRYVHIQGISAFNDGDSCLQLHNTPDFIVCYSTFSSAGLAAGEAAVDVKFSVRSHINHCRIFASGTDAWALQGFDNCNGGDWSHNTITGGTAGGAVNIGQTQGLDLKETVIESSLRGIQIAEEDGLCSNIDISNFYIEQCRDPIRLGVVFAIRGITANGGYVGNDNVDVIPDRNACWQIGRVQGLEAKGGWFVGSGTEDLLEFYKSASAPFEMARSTIRIAERSGYAADLAFDAGIADANKVRILGTNEIHITEALFYGTRKEWISQLITCNIGMTQKGVVVPTTNGGQVVSAEIVEASGALDGTLAIGSTTSSTEVLNKDLSTLTITSNTSPLTLVTQLLRPGLALLVRHTAGVAATTFRVKITYRN